MSLTLLKFAFCICLFAINCTAQFKNSIWCFGDSAGIDFSSGSPQPTISGIRSRGGVVSISDSLDNLLFYAGGTPDALNAATLKGAKIFNKNHAIMNNGDSIVGRGWYREHVIVPFPGNDNLFYVFCVGVTSIYGFYYSLVDMSQDSGLGAVVLKNVQLRDSTFIADDGLTAIKHGNGRDWWVITRNAQFSNNTYYFYLVTPDSVFFSHTQNIGDMVTNSNAFRVEPAIDGKKVAVTNSKGFMATYDFDRCSGLLSNEMIIEHDVNTMDPDSFPWYWNCTFSNNSRFLYVGRVPYSWNNPTGYLYQYDLLDTNPLLSRITIDTIMGPETSIWPKLAPDGKIYVAIGYAQPTYFHYPYPDTVYNNINMNLSVINDPDSLGIACNLTSYSFFLGGKRTYGCLPNNLNYELGPDLNSLCDTVLRSRDVAHSPIRNLNVWYHPYWGKVTINGRNISGSIYTLSVIDLKGAVQFLTSGYLSSPFFSMDLDCNLLSSGLYLINFRTEFENMSVKFIKQ